MLREIRDDGAGSVERRPREREKTSDGDDGATRTEKTGEDGEERRDSSTGVLVVDKPVGPTSFDIVRQVRRALGTRRAGHGGTLDPMASGVLPICLGEATKLAQFLLDADKEYEATLCFGVETDTFDATGTVTERRDAADLTAAARRAARWTRFAGPIRQVPPRYSALKLNGRPLYAYARAGEEVEPAPRTVVIHELELVSWTDPTAVVLRHALLQGDLRPLAGVRPGPGAGHRRAPHGAAPHALGPVPHRRGPSARRRRDARRSSGSPRPWATCRRLRAGSDAARSLEQGKRVLWSALERAPSTAPPATSARAGFRCCVRTAPCWLLPRCATTTRCARCVFH